MKENFGFIFCRNEKMQEEKMRRMKMALLFYRFWTDRVNWKKGSEIYIGGTLSHQRSLHCDTKQSQM